MITFKCKMCGGDLAFEPGASVAECPYCGTNQTLPKLDDDKRANLYDRANHFRRQNEFDKAMAIYEQVLAEDRTDAEAYWSLVLCRYGIEYVEDPASHKRVPTVNRVQYASILADEDYKSALAHADAAQRRVYETEANAIAEIQKGILDISRKEAPFDVFICYKETDANGRRTPDSVLANDMYHQLTKEGFKVFFSRITLEDKIGTAYEPYIFAALNSAKVMVVLGTKPEYFNAVWVKNEWSRYLALIRGGADKTLVPAYRDMDPYDLPEEFAHLQAQDMGKLGFMQDLIWGIKKILHKDEPKPQTVAQPATAAPANNIAPLLKRAFMFLEDGNWDSANEYAERVLDVDPENGRAYLVKLMVDLKVRRESDLKNQPQPFDGKSNYQKIMRFGDEALKKQVQDDIKCITDRIEHARQQQLYNQAVNDLNSAKTVRDYQMVIQQFEAISGFEGVQHMIEVSKTKLEEAKDEAEAIRKKDFAKAKEFQANEQWDAAIKAFKALGGYQDSQKHIEECEEEIRKKTYQQAQELMAQQHWSEAIKMYLTLNDYQDSKKNLKQCREAQNREEREAQERKEQIRQEEEKRREQERVEGERRAKEAAAKKKRITIVAIAAIVLCISAVLVYTNVIKPNSIYTSAVQALNEGRYDEATALFEELKEYKDAATQTQESQYQKGIALMAAGNYDEATAVLTAISDYNDAATQAQESQYQKGAALLAGGDYDGAIEAFNTISGYSDAVTQAQESQYQKGTAMLASCDYDGAIEAFNAISDYKDAAAQAQESQYQKGTALLASGDYDGAMAEFNAIKGYKDAAAQAQELNYQAGVTLAKAGAAYPALAALRKAGKDYKDVGDYLKTLEGVVAGNAGKIAAECWHTVGLKADGTVVAVRNNMDKRCDTGNWTDIVAIAAGNWHTVGLKANGTVVAVGENKSGQCNTSRWKNIVAVAAGSAHTVGLKADGTVVAVGENDDGQCDTSDWTDIVAVAAGGSHTVGLKSDGTVVAVGWNMYGQCNTGDWTDIVAVAAGHSHIVGLKADSTVAAVGRNKSGNCDTGDWTDIVAIAAGNGYTVGLKDDGTVVAVGWNEDGQCNTGDWTDIVAISAGEVHTVGLKADGTVVAVGGNEDGQCNTGDWKLF